MRRVKTAFMVAGLALVFSWQASGQNRTDFGVPGEALDGQPAEPAPAAESNPVEQDYTSGGPEDQAQANHSSIAISADAVSVVWALIDVNGDGRATDVEVFDARRDMRRLANHPEPSAIRDEIRKEYDANEDGVIDTTEAFVCLSEVRGELCPTAISAREFWLTLDKDNDGAVEPAEFHALLRPLGRVGEAMAGLLDNTLDAIDEDDNSRVEELEVYRRANAMMLIQLATEGDNIADRDPEDWIKYVFAVARLDLNADNTVSAEESLSVSGLTGHFEKADKDNDYALTVTELCDYQEHIDRLIAAAARSAARSSFRSGNC